MRSDSDSPPQRKGHIRRQRHPSEEQMLEWGYADPKGLDTLVIPKQLNATLVACGAGGCRTSYEDGSHYSRKTGWISKDGKPLVSTPMRAWLEQNGPMLVQRMLDEMKAEQDVQSRRMNRPWPRTKRTLRLLRLDIELAVLKARRAARRSHSRISLPVSRMLRRFLDRIT